MELEDSTTDSNKRRRTRKSKESGKSDGNVVVNEDVNTKFVLLPTEDWKENWTGPDLPKKPKWGKNSMCSRWHSKGFCFKNCSHKASHVKKGEVSKEKEEEYLKWMAECRATKK